MRPQSEFDDAYYAHLGGQGCGWLIGKLGCGGVITIALIIFIITMCTPDDPSENADTSSQSKESSIEQHDLALQSHPDIAKITSDINVDESISIIWTQGNPSDKNIIQNSDFSLGEIVIQGPADTTEPVTIIWGDGSTSSVSIDPNSMTSFVEPYKYSESGYFNGTLMITHAEGYLSEIPFIIGVDSNDSHVTSDNASVDPVVINCSQQESFGVSGESLDLPDGTTISAVIDGVTVASTLVYGASYNLSLPMCGESLSLFADKILSFVVNEVTAHEQAVVLQGQRVVRNLTFPKAEATVTMEAIDQSRWITVTSPLSPMKWYLMDADEDVDKSRIHEYQWYTLNKLGTGGWHFFLNAQYHSWSNDGSKIVFISNGDDCPGCMFIINKDGSGLTALTGDGSGPRTPSFSPDDRKIVYVEHSGGGAQIHTMNVDGSNIRALTHWVDRNKANWSNIEPSWSPDGQRIVFVSEEHGNDQIYIMNSDGSNKIRLTNNTLDDQSPSWSPDGQNIIFSRSKIGPPNEICGSFFTIRPDGSKEMALPQGLGLGQKSCERKPIWSHDGKLIAFSDPQGSVNSIWVMNSDGTNRKLLHSFGGNSGRGIRQYTWVPPAIKCIQDSDPASEIERVCD